MTTTSATSSATTPTATSLANPSSTLGKDDFLRLLVTQLKYQDPLKPNDQSQFISQMAQFSTVEGITNLQTTLETMNQSSAVSQAVGLIGKEVTYLAADGTTATGVASSVSLQGSAVTVHVGTNAVPLGDVLVVAAAPAGSPGA